MSPLQVSAFGFTLHLIFIELEAITMECAVDKSERSGPLVEFDQERLTQLMHEDPRQTTLKLTEQTNCSQMTVYHNFRSLEKVQFCFIVVVLRHRISISFRPYQNLYYYLLLLVIEVSRWVATK